MNEFLGLLDQAWSTVDGGFDSFYQIYDDVSWFINLGWVMIISIILTLVITQLVKITILKKPLASYDAIINSGIEDTSKITIAKNSKDKLLSSSGTIISMVIYVIVYVCVAIIDAWYIDDHFINIAEIDFINIFKQIATNKELWAAIPATAATVLFGSKGLYTVLHKIIQRRKDKTLTTPEKIVAAATDISTLRQEVQTVQEDGIKTLKSKGIGSN